MTAPQPPLANGAAERVRKAMRLDRCDYCGWPLRDDPGQGCIEGNCSMRPRPAQPADLIEEREAVRALLSRVAALEKENEELRERNSNWQNMLSDAEYNLQCAQTSMSAKERDEDRAALVKLADHIDPALYHGDADAPEALLALPAVARARAGRGEGKR